MDFKEFLMDNYNFLNYFVSVVNFCVLYGKK